MRTGITAGTFDLMHPGHVLMFREAKTVCDYLTVCVLVDPSKERSFKNKPIQSISERVMLVSACKYVDEVLVYDTEAELIEIFKAVNPTVRIIGEDYRNKDYTGKGLDIPMYFNSRGHSYSSSELRKRIKND